MTTLETSNMEVEIGTHMTLRQQAAYLITLCFNEQHAELEASYTNDAESWLPFVSDCTRRLGEL
jgi:hypothetical protein